MSQYNVYSDNAPGPIAPTVDSTEINVVPSMTPRLHSAVRLVVD
jgi:hypothetical protein